MRSTTLTTTLLLTLTALAFGAVLPPTLGRVVGLGPTCHRIGAQAATARRLELPAALTSLRKTGTAMFHSPLSPRDDPRQYNPCGILRGNQRSVPFTLDPNNIYNAFWVDDRGVIGVGGNSDHLMNSADMHVRHLQPFRPQPNRQYALELSALDVPGGEDAVASWYFATQ